jgi:LysR family transcriptional regulator, glycine cleavage system transcriptional activator
MNRLPPLNALRAFDAAARHLSFKQAGEELCVTAGAVSRHISNLESFLGAALFVRSHRQVALTSAGETYLREVHHAFERIAQATATLNSRCHENLLRLKLPPTFAIRWLVPRLGRFHARHPEISVQVTTSHDPVDFDRDEVDAAVVYGTDLGRELAGERLVPEALIPVCHAACCTHAIASPERLAGKVLLHSIRRPDDWPRWFAAVGVPNVELRQSLVFENSSMTFQGAMDGLGVALAQLAFVLDELRTGRVVSPVPYLLRRDMAYYFSYPKDCSKPKAIYAFHRWLSEEAVTSRTALDKDQFTRRMS